MVVEVNDWNPRLYDRPQAMRVKPRDDSITIPILEPGWYGVVERPLLDGNGPGAVLAHVLCRAAEDFAAIAHRRLDNERNARGTNPLSSSLHHPDPEDAATPVERPIPRTTI